MDNGTETSIQSIARIVTLYRARNIKPYQWESQARTYNRSVAELLRADYRRLRHAHAFGRELRSLIEPVHELAASAVAFVLLDDGQPPHVVRRFLLPAPEDTEDGDPRTAMHRALRRPPSHYVPQWTMGIMLNAWGVWVTGLTCRELSWRHESPIPRVAGWPAFAIPTPRDQVAEADRSQ